MRGEKCSKLQSENSSRKSLVLVRSNRATKLYGASRRTSRAIEKTLMKISEKFSSGANQDIRLLLELIPAETEANEDITSPRWAGENLPRVFFADLKYF